MRPTFGYDAAFREIFEEHVYGVWVGEHGFLVAIFGYRDHAEDYIKRYYPNDRDAEINRIDIN